MGLLRAPLLAILLLAFALAGCGGGPGPSGATEPSAGSSERLSIPGAGDALAWGDGELGVVLAHGAVYDAASWSEQAEAIADEGATALATESTAAEDLLAAAEYLRSERGAERVAFLGASAGADATLNALAEQPEAADSLITLSANTTIEGLGEEPKLFIASEDEPVAGVSEQLAADAPGPRNDALLLPGDAHAQAIFDGPEGKRALEQILARLDEVRPG